TTSMTTTTSIDPRLLQLASPTLPVGAYSYSGGLESAVEAGIVTDAASAQRWIGDVLEHSVLKMEAPLLLRLIEEPDARWNEDFLASRETAELRAETVQMGYSLNRLLPDLGVEACPYEEPSFPAVFAQAVRAWGIPARQALTAYLWAWLENQVMAAVKAVPLGQTDGQKMLLALGARLQEVSEDEPGNFAPGLAILSSRHETQYSRLFRS
ncbi:MAG TPA: urease accessory protein UreF, partial [Steroidobacteraceae bacterium]|nr:urease accessory protein UreF [Steroidobacteraceae bacterium]